MSEQLSFDFAVKDNASKSIGEIEQSYVSLMRSLDAAVKQISDAMETFSRALGKANDVVEESEPVEKKKISRLKELGKAIREDAVGLEKYGVTWKNFLKILAGATIIGGLVALYKFFTGAVDKTREFNREFLKLNAAFAMNASQSKQVAGGIMSMMGVAGATRDEVMQLGQDLLHLGYAPGKQLKGLGVTFKSLAKDVFEFGKVTGMSSAASAAFMDHLNRVSSIPPSRFRSMATAVKHIADTFKMTSDEVVEFMKSLDEVTARIEGKEQREAFMKNAATTAAALDQLGVDGKKAMGAFGQMLSDSSNEGREALNSFSRALRMPFDEVQRLIKSDPARLFDQLSKSLGQMDTSEIDYLANTVKPLGLSFGELSKLARKGRGEFEKGAETVAKSFSDLAKQTDKASKDKNKLTNVARSMTDSIDAAMNHLQQKWDAVMRKVGGALERNVIQPLMTKLLPLFDKFADWLMSADFDAAFKTVVDGFVTSIEYAIKFKNEIFGLVTALGVLKVASMIPMGIFGKSIPLVIKDMSLLKGVVLGLKPVATAVFGGISVAGVAAFAAVAVGVGAAAYQVHKHWDEMPEMFSAIAGNIEDRFGGVVKFFGESTTTMRGWWKSATDYMGEKFEEALGSERWQRWKDNVGKAWQWVKDTAAKVIAWIGENMNPFKDIAEVFKGVANIAKELWSGKIGERMHDILEKDRDKTGFGEVFSEALGQAAIATEAPSAPVPAPRSPATGGKISQAKINPEMTRLAAGVPEVNVPGTMVTSSPNQERLLQMIASLQEQQVSLLKAARIGVQAGATAARDAFIAERAGG